MSASQSIHAVLRKELTAPGCHTRIEDVELATGDRASVATIRTIVGQQTPNGWRLYTKKDGDALDVYRLA